MARGAGLLAALLLAGCTLPELTPRGAAVEVGSAARAGCKPLGTTRDSEGMNGRSAESNVEAAWIALRNQAAALGGDLIVLTEKQQGTVSGGLMAEEPGGLGMKNNGCPNCVSLVASVYQCGTTPRSGAP
jgi:hypothetical protein